MKHFLIPLIAGLALPTAVNASVTFNRIYREKCYNFNPSFEYLNEPKGSPCFEWIEENDGDPAVYILGKRHKNFESQESKRPIPWGLPGAKQGSNLTLSGLEMRLWRIENGARKKKGLKKFSWQNRTYKLTSRSSVY